MATATRPVIPAAGLRLQPDRDAAVHPVGRDVLREAAVDMGGGGLPAGGGVQVGAHDVSGVVRNCACSSSASSLISSFGMSWLLPNASASMPE